MAIDELWPDEWYHPDITNPEYGVRPIDLEFGRELYRLFHGHMPAAQVSLHTAAERLANSPWLAAIAGCWMFNAAGRTVIDEAAWPGEVRWLPLVIETPSGPVDEYQIIAPPLDRGDVLSETHTTRGRLGKPIRWVLDRDKLGDRRVLMVPGVPSAGLVMRGRVLQRLLDLGAKGIVIQPARVMSPAPSDCLRSAAYDELEMT